jgi:hypothetical protein
MDKYFKHAECIDGWFDYKIIVPILWKLNGIQSVGNILEIGVHHGKSFIPMIFLLHDNEEIMAVDIFEDQQFNVDGSGHGSHEIFVKHIQHICQDNAILSRVKIMKGDTTKLKSTDYMTVTNNKFRIISIDGSHTKHATIIDLNNAMNILSSDGFIIIDDYFNNDWPGVRAGVEHVLENNNNYRIFYLDKAKMFVCHVSNYNKFFNVVKHEPNNIALHYEQRCCIAGTRNI